MRLVYWYTPFKSMEGDVRFFVTAGNKHQAENAGTILANKKKRYVSCIGRTPKLAGIGENESDRLYVVAHGDQAAGYLSGDEKAEATLDAQGLVTKMEADGCNWLLDDLRIYACLGALGVKSFVEEFAKLVRAKNPGLKVYGYTAVLDRTTGPGNKQARSVMHTDQGRKLLDPAKASTRRRVFKLEPEDDQELDVADPDPFGDAHNWVVPGRK